MTLWRNIGIYEELSDHAMVRSFYQTAGTGAFDIQEQALTATQKRLNAGHVPENYRLLLESHANMAEYATPDSVSCIVFNFGYLPGGDHSLATRGKTSIQALTQAIPDLKSGIRSLTG